MKLKSLLTSVFMLIINIVNACPVCEEQQPQIIRGISHGVGADSYLDWVIIFTITAITLLVLFYSVKHLIYQKENKYNHIKETILNNQ